MTTGGATSEGDALSASTGAGNRALSQAKSAKQDEFYTQLVDIENELKHYRAQLRGKVALCNCDDPYTNLDFARRHEHLSLFRTYSPDLYPNYVNYDAIEVGRYTEIPVDYYGKMGLPVTALSKLSPDQFEIIGFSGSLARPMAEVVSGQTGSGRFYLDMGGQRYRRMYDRVVIRYRQA